MEQVKKLGCHVERSSRSEVLCFDHKPKCKFVLGEISQVLLTVYQSITGWMPPRLWAARAENGDGKIWLTNFTMFAINPSFFPSWEKGYYTTVYHVTSQAAKITFRYVMVGHRSQLLVSLHSQIQVKPVRLHLPSTLVSGLHLGD